MTSFLRGIRQDLRSKELKWLLVALIISVSALTSVSFLADRMHRAFEFDARQLLASDLLIAADQPLPAQLIEEAQSRQLRIAQTVVFPSMATAGEHSKLASLKAVSPEYPLRGSLQVEQVNSQAPPLSPVSGTVFVEPALLTNLHTKVGDLLRLGDRQFLISGVLTRELDRGAAFMNFAPRVMMSLDDLKSTGLISLGSRVTYRLLLAGSDNQIAAYQQWANRYIETQNFRGLRIETLENAQPTMRKTLEKAEQFLSLIALLTAMIAAVAIGLSARRYMVGQADACAALKCFGATRATILKKQIKTLLTLGVVAAIVGSTLGYLVQEVLTGLLGNLLLGNLSSISIGPILWSILFTWVLLFGFAGPPLLGLANVSPMRLIRKEFELATLATAWVALLAITTCAFLIWVAARDWKLALWVGLSFAGAIVIFSAAARGVLWLLSKINPQNFALRFTITAMGRRAGFAVMQITALGIAMMAILMILLLRQDLLNAWQGNIPVDAPNRFMINIQGDQKVGITQTLEAGGVSKPDFSPMVRGRLVELNGRDISSADYSEENAKRLIDREFNLSYTEQLPLGNRIVSGKWISGDSPQVSIETGIARTLKLKLGDQMTFEVAGEKISAPITSLRKLDWGSMRVNFFVIMPPSQLSALPQSWITSYYQNPNKETLDFQLSQAYPNLTLVDVSASLRQIQDVLNKLSAALGLLFAFTIVAAILVLIAAIAATQDERYRNAALLKAMGASRAVLTQIARIELLVIGFTAGLLAGIASGLAAWALGRFVMEIEFNAFAQAILMGVAFGVIASMAAGYRFQNRIQGATAIECLREA
ncbi:ABC transporter permease [Polynucleobacter sp. es-GGE-1]|uniref:ABC transporter permease n=1 Tax=Polynucleobacter sp. es-GGE-1 TaxID=1819724 RepID=UPI0021068B3B|nr:FtsX-like permease family protein [Polynucleobacter sp. es-GGE-1]